MKLKKMTDFVLEIMESNSVESWKKIGIIEDYARLLKQPLTLGMFIPCGENGNPLEEPNESDYPLQTGNYLVAIQNYQQAKERVLFDGYQLVFEFKKWQSTLIAKNKDGLGQFDIYDYETIEDLVFMDLTLTDNAIKQLGL